MKGPPCLQRALFEAQDIIRSVSTGTVAELLLDDSTKRTLAAPGYSPYAYAYGWLEQAVESHIGGYCACTFDVTDTTSRIRPAPAPQRAANG